MKIVQSEHSIYWIWIWILVFNVTFSNISAISWRPVLVVEEARVPGENLPKTTWDHRYKHEQKLVRPYRHNTLSTSFLLVVKIYQLYHLRLQVECTLFGNLQNWARTHAVLVIGLYELLDPTHWATLAPLFIE
jgi:hypothetical protein